ncbi:MAG: hypothetical protein ACTSYI_17440 [Promethearchaeota archaeon]
MHIKRHIFLITGSLSTFFIVIWVVLLKFNNLDQLLTVPPLSPSDWFLEQPWVEVSFAQMDFVWMQPSSSVLVYILGIIASTLGIILISKHGLQKSNVWWGIALILWGIGAVVAGTSYQAFSYELKCRDQTVCLWTSLWEIMYMLLSAGSVNAMVVAHAYSCSLKKNRPFYYGYAFVSMIVYFALILVGSIFPNRFFVSFELLILFLVPAILLLLGSNIWRSRKYHLKMDRALIRIWVGLGVVMALYYGYLLLGFTEDLWEHGIWFSDNDVLHLGLIAWMFLIRKTVSNLVIDYDNADNTEN